MIIPQAPSKPKRRNHVSPRIKRHPTQIVSMCGQKVSLPLRSDNRPLDRQRDFRTNVSKPSACRIYYSGRLEPRKSLCEAAQDGRTGKVQINRNKHNKNLLYHHSLDAIVNQNEGRAWLHRHYEGKFKRLVHADTEIPRDLEEKIFVLTGGYDLNGTAPSGGGPQTSRQSCLRKHTDIWRKDDPASRPVASDDWMSQTSREAHPPTRTLLERRTSIDLSIVRLKVHQKLVALYEMFDVSGDGDLNELEFRKATDMMNFKPFKLSEIRRELEDKTLLISINPEGFLKLIKKRINCGSAADQVFKHQNLLDVLAKFKLTPGDDRDEAYAEEKQIDERWQKANEQKLLNERKLKRTCSSVWIV